MAGKTQIVLGPGKAKKVTDLFKADAGLGESSMSPDKSWQENKAAVKAGQKQDRIKTICLKIVLAKEKDACYNKQTFYRMLLQYTNCVCRIKAERGRDTMAHYVISDIHGESDRFHALLKKIHFTQNDMLYMIGDVVDRGPDGIALLQEIMRTPNMVMLLGNHEYMMLQYLSPNATEIEIRRWNRNGNAPTLAAYLQLNPDEREEILSFLRARPTHLEMTINGRKFYLVHGFPGENVHDEVWGRPDLHDPNPIPDCQLIIGHTPVLCLGRTDEEQTEYGMKLERMGEHLRICHAPGFIDIDCGCGHRIPFKALACLRLEDMEESYA